MMIVSASPMMKPLSTGSETKLARKPRRSKPAANASSPVISASAAAKAAMLSPVAMPAREVAESAAVADMGPVTR
jgi:hypothetical protein